MDKKIINLTGHDVVLEGVTTIPMHGNIRLSSSTMIVEHINGVIPVTKTEYGCGFLPDEEEGTILIVGLIICNAYPQRKDLYIPAGKNKTRGYNSLSQNPFYSVSVCACK